jgi:hypothetical protein
VERLHIKIPIAEQRRPMELAQIPNDMVSPEKTRSCSARTASEDRLSGSRSMSFDA